MNSDFLKMTVAKSSRLTSAVAVVAILAVLAERGEAVVCYQCNSAFDPRCGDPFDPYSLGTVNCSFQPKLEHLHHMEPTLCRKISQKVYGKLRVVRGCGYITDERDNGKCMRRTGTHDVIAHYCACTDDLCNSSNEKLPSVGIIGFLAVILTFVRM